MWSTTPCDKLEKSKNVSHWPIFKGNWSKWWSTVLQSATTGLGRVNSPCSSFCFLHCFRPSRPCQLVKQSCLSGVLYCTVQNLQVQFIWQKKHGWFMQRWWWTAKCCPFYDKNGIKKVVVTKSLLKRLWKLLFQKTKLNETKSRQGVKCLRYYCKK